MSCSPLCLGVYMPEKRRREGDLSVLFQDALAHRSDIMARATRLLQDDARSSHPWVSQLPGRALLSFTGLA